MDSYNDSAILIVLTREVFESLGKTTKYRQIPLKAGFDFLCEKCTITGIVR